MASVVSDIIRVCDLRRLAAEIDKECRRLTCPTLADERAMPELCETVLSRYEKAESAMALLLLYDPKSLIGHKMRKGLGAAVADSLHISTRSLCRMKRKALWLYRNHRQYRMNVDSAMANLTAYISAETKRQKIYSRT